MPEIADIRKELNRRRGDLDGIWDQQRGTYQDIQEFIAPWSGIGIQSDLGSDELHDGSRKDLSILDPTAVFALDILSAGMQSGLTSPARPWFRLGFSDDNLREIQSVKTWLYQVENMMRFIFSRSNVYKALHHCYKELGGFGTAAMAVLFDYDKVIRCRPFTCGEYRIALSPDLKVDTFLHYNSMSARQMVGKFGEENCSDSVVRAYKDGKAEELFRVGWLVEPNDSRLDKVKDFMRRPNRSIYFEVDGTEDKMLELGWYQSFPVLCPRWYVVSNRVYGIGPGHVVLGHTKMLQKMQEDSLVALAKQNDPPLVGPSTVKASAVNTMPGGVTAVDEMANTHGLRPLHEVRTSLQELEFKIGQVQNQIRTGMFNDLFLMLANQPLRSGVTATEIAERHEEKLIMLGPVLESLHSELLDPLIDRVFEIMLDKQLIPPPPQQIQGKALKVEYISVLAQAQKMVGTASVNQFSQFVAAMAALNPEALDKIDVDEAVDVYADMTGVPPSIVVPDEQAAGKRSARAKQNAAAQMAATMLPASQAAKNMSETQMNNNSALDALLGRTGGIQRQ